MINSILNLRDIHKTYGDAGVQTEVLHGINLELHQGEFTALIGPSGSGKSTLLHIMGLLEQPSSGQIVILGQQAVGLSEEELTLLRGRSIGFVFQFHHLIPAFTALENVMMPLMLECGRPTTVHRRRATELLERVGLADRLHYKPSKRVAIARALAMDPPLVLADEPTGNLDSAAADGVFELLHEVNRNSGTTFLIVTHDPRLASRCSRTIELVDGLITANV
jgi:lipoprotein-releasing system ATP-binding protein